MEFGGLALLAPGLALVAACGEDLDLVADLRGLLARDLVLGFVLRSVMIRAFRFDASQVALGVRCVWTLSTRKSA